MQFEVWDQIWNPPIKANLVDHKMKGDWKLYFLPRPLKIQNLGINAHGIEQVDSWKSGTIELAVLQSHISPDPVNF